MKRVRNFTARDASKRTWGAGVHGKIKQTKKYVRRLVKQKLKIACSKKLLDDCDMV